MINFRALALGMLLGGVLYPAHAGAGEATTNFTRLARVANDPGSDDQAVTTAMHGIRAMLDKGSLAAADRESVRAIAREYTTGTRPLGILGTAFMLCAALREPEFTELLQRFAAGTAPMPAVTADTALLSQVPLFAARALHYYEFAAIPPGSAPAVAVAGKIAPFNVAIKNTQDATLEPIARFDGTKWVNTWPEAEAMSEPVPELDALPEQWLGGKPARTWYVLAADGGRVAVQVSAAGRRHECVGIPSLKLTAESALRLTRMEPLLAVDTQQEIRMVRAVAKSDWDWSEMERVVRSNFQQNQAALLSGREDHNWLPAESDLEGQPIVLEFLVRRATDADTTLYYFEASRMSSRPLVSPGGATRPVQLIVAGWLVKVAPQHWSAVGLRARAIRGSESAPVPSTVPLGTITINNRLFWVSEIRGYEGYGAELVEVTAQGVTRYIVVGRGGC